MKTLITITLLILALGATAQNKPVWTEGGGVFCIGCSTDTVTRHYYLAGKDSISFSIQIENCNCQFYVEIGEHKVHPCKNLQRHYLETSYWHWEKSITTCKGKVISQVKPHWETNMGMSSMIDGVFTVDGRQVDPCRLLYKGKAPLIINNY
jgi:hypothetical protein